MSWVYIFTEQNRGQEPVLRVANRGGLCSGGPGDAGDNVAYAKKRKRKWADIRGRLSSCCLT